MDSPRVILGLVVASLCVPVGCGAADSTTTTDTDTDTPTGAATDASTGPGPSGDCGPGPADSSGSGGPMGSDSGTTGAQACVVVVDQGGEDALGCGAPASPCATVTQGIVESLGEPCVIEIGPGVYDRTWGETFPLVVPAGVDLRGSGSDPEGAPTVLDGSGNTDGALFDVTCDETPQSLASTVRMGGCELSELMVVGGPGTNYATVLITGGENLVDGVRVQGGQEGIFTAGTSTATIVDSHLSGAGHAALKPAGDSVVDVDNVVMTASKDALEPICRATVTVMHSEALCNGNGLEALDRATTTMIDNDVHHNINGIAARGGNTSIIARDNRVHDNSFGVVEIFGVIELGDAAAPGGNDLSGNRFAALMLNHVPTQTDAVGNAWEPNVDGADAMGEFSGDVTLTGPICGANNSEIEAPIPEDCDPSASVARAPSYQNFALNDGSCGPRPMCGGAGDPCPALGSLVLSGS